MRRLSLYLIILIFSGCTSRFVYYTPPLPGVTSVLETPEFWVSRLPNPDSLLLNETGLKLFNQEIEEMGSYFNVIEEDTTFYRKELREKMDKTLRRFKSSNRVSHSGLPFTKEFWEEIKERMNLNEMPFKIDNIYGITISKVHLRDLPTNEIAVSSWSCEFNRMQVTMLRPFEPVLVLHETRERDWLYVKSGLAEGWVGAEDIVTDVRESIASYLAAPFVVVTGADVPLYADKHLDEFLGWLPMGTRVKLDEILSDEVISVIVPVKGEDGRLGHSKAYLENDVYVNLGYLPYTQRNVIKQAFRLLSFPYGWGGTWDSDDCSGIILRIYSCFGINLPRNSSQQLKVGINVASFTKETKDEDREEALKNAIPGITLLGWRGHIMLYLGEFDGHHYCLQNTWGFKKKRWFTEDIHYIGKVVVSDLSLGRGTRGGSQLDRLTNVRVMLPIIAK